MAFLANRQSVLQRQDVADEAHALQGLLGLDSLKQSARLAGLCGGLLLILVAVVAWLGTAATGLDGFWLAWAVGPALAAAFGGAWLAAQLLGRRSLTRWRLALVGVMTLSGTAWAFAATVVGAAHPESLLLPLVCWLALALALVPALTWLPGLAAQLLLQLLFVLALTMLPELGGRAAVLPLGAWLALATLAAMATLFARRFTAAQGELHYMRFESSEVQKRFDESQSRLRESEEQRKTLEAELAEILSLAEDASRAKTEFLATMSHEIRTPLNGILPILEMLRDTRLDEEQTKLVRTAQSSSRHLLRIINDILDFAKVESGKLQLEAIEIDVRDLVGSVIELMSGSARNRNLHLSTKVADDVPQVVRGDPIRLRQVLINLVSNAVKFTEEGGIRVEVSRGQSSQKEVELLFAVADTGMGMTDETADRLFQSFSQADASTTRKHGGTGLGLAICKRLVELMGGKIGVRSSLGQGSTFWFLVPLRKSIMEVPSARRDLKGVRLLTLIPDAQVAARVGSDLRRWGVLQEVANDPSEALSKLRSMAMLGESWAYDLILLDAAGIESRLATLLGEIRGDDLLKRMHIVAAVRSDTLARKFKQEFSVMVLTGGMRTEPLRRMLHRLFDVESRHFGNPDLTPEEIYDDLNVSAADVPLAVASPPSGGSEFVGRVLLVEDNPVNLGVMQRALSRLGLSCEVAADGAQALATFERQRFDILFMDCQMPVMDGYEATRRIRRYEEAHERVPTPIIAMTANAMAGDRERCIVAGMDDYLPKPVGLDQLRSCLTDWLTDASRLPRRSGLDTPQPAPAENPTVIDADVLQDLQDVMGEDYRDLLRTFLDNTPQLLVAAHTALAEGSSDDLVLPVHSLKSSSANVGAMLLSQAAKAVELLARGDRIAEAETAMQAVDAAWRDAETALKTHLATHSVGRG